MTKRDEERLESLKCGPGSKWRELAEREKYQICTSSQGLRTKYLYESKLSIIVIFLNKPKPNLKFEDFAGLMDTYDWDGISNPTVMYVLY